MTMESFALHALYFSTLLTTISGCSIAVAITNNMFHLRQGQYNDVGLLGEKGYNFNDKGWGSIFDEFFAVNLGLCLVLVIREVQRNVVVSCQDGPGRCYNKLCSMDNKCVLPNH
jgi:hypothetical protein